MEKANLQFEALRAQNEQLKNQLMATSLINEITKVMLASKDLESVFRTISLGIKETLEFERIIVFRVDPENSCIRPFAWEGFPDNEPESLSVPLGFSGGEIVDSIFLNKPVIADNPDPKSDPLAPTGTKGYVAIPIITKVVGKCRDYKNCDRTDCPAYDSYNPYCWSIQGASRMLGTKTEDERQAKCAKCGFFKCHYILWVDKPGKGGSVTGEDMNVLTTLVHLVGIVIDNFEMYDALGKANKSLKDRNAQIQKINSELDSANKKINKDLDQARSIQEGLLPQKFPEDKRLDIASHYMPESKIGGDYYDVFNIADNLYGVVIADVSGHGSAAALIMAMFKILLKTFSVLIESPDMILDRINKAFLSDVETDSFVTVFFAFIDLNNNKMVYSSAGHNPVILLDRKTGEFRELGAQGVFLGVFDDMQAEATEVDMPPGSRLFLYTDGLTEAAAPDGSMFSYEKLLEIVQNSPESDSAGLKKKILDELHSFMDGSEPADDITMLIIDMD
ncbi:MAG: GAF domain-containing SpoIIE family protein phosphatase [Fibrobacterota bacterium]